MAGHEHPLLSYSELIAELRQLLSGRATGIMFISTANNHAIHIGIQTGEIVGCRYRFKRGIDALPPIMEMEAGRYSFNPGSSGSDDPALPPTDVLLKMLSERNQGAPADVPIQGTNQPSEAHALIATELALYLGPIASVIIEDYLDDIGQVHDSGALQKMLGSVASEIADERKREEFTKSVLSKL